MRVSVALSGDTIQRLGHRRDATVAFLMQCGHGESDIAYMAKRLAVALERDTLADDVVEALEATPPGDIVHLLQCLVQRGATMPCLNANVRRCLVPRREAVQPIRRLLAV